MPKTIDLSPEEQALYNDMFFPPTAAGKSSAASAIADEGKDENKPENILDASATPGKEEVGKEEGASTTPDASKNRFADEKPVPKAEFKKRLDEEAQKRLSVEKTLEQERLKRTQLENELVSIHQKKAEEKPQKPEETPPEISDEEFEALGITDETVKKTFVGLIEKKAKQIIRNELKPLKDKQIIDEQAKRIMNETEYKKQITKDFPDAAVDGSELDVLATEIYKAKPVYSKDITGLRAAVELATERLKIKKLTEEVRVASEAAGTVALKKSGRVESPGGGSAAASKSAEQEEEDRKAAEAYLGKGAFKRR